MSKGYIAGPFVSSDDSTPGDSPTPTPIPITVVNTNEDGKLDATILPNNDEDNTSELLAFHDAKPSTLVIVLTFVASISGFMFGYDTGYISSALVAIGTDLGKTLTYGEKEYVTSATSLGALIAALFAGVCADLFGRKPVLLFSNLLFIAGSGIQCGAHTLWTMIAGRFIMGFGVGVGSLIAPLYISETAPTKYRGRLVVINVLAITGGQLVAYGIGAGLTNVNNGWRILVGLSIIPPAIQAVVFLFLPDTPRYLILKGRYEQAANVIKRTYKSADIDLINCKVEELAALNQEIEGDNVLAKTWNSIKEIHRVPSNLRALVIACGLQGIQQFTGWNSLMYFSATVFETIGFNNSTAVSIIIAATNFIFTCVAFFVIDRVGRRRILLIGLPGICISLVVCAIAFHFLGIKFDGDSATVATDGISAWGVVVIVSMIAFAACYAVGIGNVPWQQSELFPQKVRGVGASYATAVNWAGCLVIASSFLTMLQNITPTGTFVLFAALSAVSFVFVFFCYPELSNLELEEVQQVLTGGFNIVASQKLAKKRRADTVKRHHRTLNKSSASETTEEVVVTSSSPIKN